MFLHFQCLARHIVFQSESLEDFGVIHFSTRFHVQRQLKIIQFGVVCKQNVITLVQDVVLNRIPQLRTQFSYAGCNRLASHVTQFSFLQLEADSVLRDREDFQQLQAQIRALGLYHYAVLQQACGFGVAGLCNERIHLCHECICTIIGRRCRCLGFKTDGIDVTKIVFCRGGKIEYLIEIFCGRRVLRGLLRRQCVLCHKRHHFGLGDAWFAGYAIHTRQRCCLFGCAIALEQHEHQQRNDQCGDTQQGNGVGHERVEKNLHEGTVGCHRNDGWCFGSFSDQRRAGQGFLQLRQLQVTQPDDLLGRRNLLFQQAQTLGELCILQRGTIGLFALHSQNVFQAGDTGVKLGALAAGGLRSRLCTVNTDDTQLAPWRTGRISRCRGRCAQRLGAQRHIAAVLEQLILPRHFADRLSRTQRPYLFDIWYAQNLSAANHVDVAADEGIRVQPLDSQHCLLYRHRAVRSNLQGNVPEGVIRVCRNGVLRSWRGQRSRRCCRFRHGRCRSRHFRCRSRKSIGCCGGVRIGIHLIHLCDQIRRWLDGICSGYLRRLLRCGEPNRL